jgi:hypothetical protein
MPEQEMTPEQARALADEINGVLPNEADTFYVDDVARAVAAAGLDKPEPEAKAPDAREAFHRLADRNKEGR